MSGCINNPSTPELCICLGVICNFWKTEGNSSAVLSCKKLFPWRQPQCSKGKKGGKPESKIAEESDAEKAKANAALWEARLDITEQSRVEYREAARKLARANEELTSQQYRVEKDTVEIIAFLKKKEAEKDEQIEKLQQQLRDLKRQAREEKEELVSDYTQQLNELDEKFKKKSNELRMVQSEMKTIKEFRKKKAQMEKELEDIKENLYIAKKEHKEIVARMEHKFFGEKLRLEKEAEKKIAQLAERAHNEAIVQLDDAARSVFKENVRLNEALSYHMKEAEELKKMTVKLAEENKDLIQKQVTSELLVEEKVSQVVQLKKEVVELQRKVACLEQGLGHMACEFEAETNMTLQKALISTKAGKVEIDKLQKLLDMKDREMNRVKKLAKNIVDQRTEVERFFLEALDHAKQEVRSSRAQYKQAAQVAYQRKMQEAYAGKEEHPKIRTFTKNEHSTNNVYQDLREAENWANVQSNRVDISELTWEQKEKVLRVVFAKMNGLKTRKPTRDLSLSAPTERSIKDKEDPGSLIQDNNPSLTFITQAPLPGIPSQGSILPDIQAS
ncbi:basal body-orientation factor 1-like isoform X1 [Acipenser ruthenus]|uniref:basal body-orientation factor 1-like isoform X1 n=1 Tax=Acipenser ruthenus TaxID=7906 RepID=UPI0027416D67|nr:basal body-orientation factor 1-like isoform X1 [Acipenser ruthenus]